MDMEELEPKQKRTVLRDLQPMSIEELEEYISRLESEIARAEEAIAKKIAHKQGLSAFFGSSGQSD